MDLIEDLIAAGGPGLIEKLTGAGLEPGQAQEFLPDALQSVVEALQQLDIQALIQADRDTQASSLLDKIDIPALASHVDGDSGLASSGLLAVIPGVLGFLQDNPAAGNLLNMPGKASELMGLAKDFLH